MSMIDYWIVKRKCTTKEFFNVVFQNYVCKFSHIEGVSSVNDVLGSDKEDNLPTESNLRRKEFTSFSDRPVEETRASWVLSNGLITHLRLELGHLHRSTFRWEFSIRQTT